MDAIDRAVRDLYIAVSGLKGSTRGTYDLGLALCRYHGQIGRMIDQLEAGELRPHEVANRARLFLSREGMPDAIIRQRFDE